MGWAPEMHDPHESLQLLVMDSQFALWMDEANEVQKKVNVIWPPEGTVWSQDANSTRCYHSSHYPASFRPHTIKCADKHLDCNRSLFLGTMKAIRQAATRV